MAVGGSPGALAIGGGFVWAASVPGDEVARIDPRTETRTQTIPLGGARVTALAFGLGGLWIADATGNSLIELDPTTGAIRRTVRLHLRPSALAIGKRTIWVADYETNSIAGVDIRSGDPLQTVHVGSGPASLVVADEAIWVANSLDSTVSKVDPASGRPGHNPGRKRPHGPGRVRRIDLGREPLLGHAVAHRSAAGRGDAHRAPRGPPNRARHDRRATVGRNEAQSLRRGGTLTLLHTRPLSIDPALQLDIRRSRPRG